MATQPPRIVAFSYDDLLFLALVLEYFIGQTGRTLPTDTALGQHDARAQIAQAEAILARLNEARR